MNLLSDVMCPILGHLISVGIPFFATGQGSFFSPYAPELISYQITSVIECEMGKQT